MDSFRNNKNFFPTVLLFAATVFLAYLPISSFLFFVKNDAFSNYFPPKFFMSESIRDGYLPLWNPYINFGIPQYGDMNSGYWSPVTWLLASTVGYNAYSFTLELLAYILIGGLGMYKLSGYWVIRKDIRVMMGVVFMCCGFNVAHLQHFNWISGTSFLPWCLWSYLVFLRQPKFYRLMLCAMLFYLFVSSAHPGMIIGSAYYFVALLIFAFFQNEHNEALFKRLQAVTAWHLALAVVVLVLSAGLIIGYADIIPQFVRGEKIKLADSLPHSSHLSTWISLALPFATVKNPELFNTDLTLRNSYFGLFFFVLLIAAAIGKKTKWQFFFLVAGCCFALLSAGGIFKTFGHHFLPYIGYVRLNGEFRIFAILSFILVAGIMFEKLAEGTAVQRKQQTKWPLMILGSFLLFLITWAIYKISIQHNSLIFRLEEMPVASRFPERAKFVIDSFSFYDTILIQGILQLSLLIFTWRPFLSGKIRKIKLLVIADVVLATLLNVPFTGAGQTSVAHLQSVLDRSPDGIPVPALHPIGSNDTILPVDNALLGEWYVYNKQPGAPRELAYPIQLKNMRGYFDGIQEGQVKGYLDKAFIFSIPPGTGIRITDFSPNRIEIVTQSADVSTIVLQQNKYPHWFYKAGSEIRPVQGAGVNFMSAPIKPGNNKITFFFNPRLVRLALLSSGIVFLVYLVWVILLYKKKL